MAAKKVTKLKLETRDIITDVTENFYDLLTNDISVSEFKVLVEDLTKNRSDEAKISVSFDFDDWSGDSSWTWTLSEKRQETVEEHKERIKREKEREKQEQRWAAQAERVEKKEYLRLKKKFEGK